MGSEKYGSKYSSGRLGLVMILKSSEGRYSKVNDSHHGKYIFSEDK